MNKYRGVWSAPNLRACLTIDGGEAENEGVGATRVEVREAKVSNPRRRVSFYGTVSVTLIPSRKEYSDAKLIRNMWWGTSSYEAFQSRAIEEIQHAMSFHRLSCKDACAHIYCGDIPCVDSSKQLEATQLLAHEKEPTEEGPNYVLEHLQEKYSLHPRTNTTSAISSPTRAVHISPQWPR